MKSQCPTLARQVAARAFSRGWTSVRVSWDAHSGISIGRKTPTPRILDDRKKTAPLRLPLCLGGCGQPSPLPPPPPSRNAPPPPTTPALCRHRAAETTDRTQPSAHREESTLRVLHGKYKYGRTYVTSWSCLLRWCCRSLWRWSSLMWRMGYPPPVRRTRPRSKRTWPRIKVRSDHRMLTLVPPTHSSGPLADHFCDSYIACEHLWYIN